MKKRWIVALCSLFMIFGMSMSGWASSQLQQIKAYLNGELTIKLDGQTVQLRDANGKQVQPITYQGTTYLPIRAVSDLLDIDVKYDGTEKVVYLGEAPDIPAPEVERDGSLKLVSWSDRKENGQIIVSGTVQNNSNNGQTGGMVVTGFDSNKNAIEAKGTSGYISSGSVRNFEIKLDNAADIATIEADVTGYASGKKLLAKGIHTEDGKVTVTGVVENGHNNGTNAGIVATGFGSGGKAIETKGTSGYISSNSVRNFEVTLDANNIGNVEVELAGLANNVKLLSEASRQVDGKLEVTLVVENGTSNGQTAGVVVTGHTNSGKAVDTKGTSGYISSNSVRNFTVTLDSANEIASFKTELTREN